MLLPFMKNRNQDSGSASKTVINSEGKINAPSSEDNMGLMAACEDLIQAIHNKDSRAMAEALKNAMACMED